MKQKTLYVDNIENVTFGRTSNWNKISRNLQAINTKGVEEFSTMMGEANLATLVDTAGKYIFYLTGSLDEREMEMVFIDCQNDIDVALSFCAAVFHGNTQLINMFMGRFSELQPVYNIVKDDFVIKTGNPA